MSHVDSFGQIYEFGDLNGDHTEGLEKYEYLTSYYIIEFLHPNYFVMKEKHNIIMIISLYPQLRDRCPIREAACYTSRLEIKLVSLY